MTLPSTSEKNEELFNASFSKVGYVTSVSFGSTPGKMTDSSSKPRMNIDHVDELAQYSSGETLGQYRSTVLVHSNVTLAVSDGVRANSTLIEACVAVAAKRRRRRNNIICFVWGM